MVGILNWMNPQMRGILGNNANTLTGLGASLLQYSQNTAQPFNAQPLMQGVQGDQQNRQTAAQEAEKQKAKNLTHSWLLTQGLARDENEAAMITSDPVILNATMKKLEPPKAPDYPSSFDEWKLAQANPAYAAHLAQKEAPIKIEMPAGETAFDKEAGTSQAKRFDEIIQSGHQASGMLGDLNQLAAISKNIKTGKEAQVTAALGPWAESLGVKIDGLGEVQAYEAIVARMAPQMRPAGSGSSSDYDARQFLRSLPSIGNTPEGNEIIQETFRAVAEHKQAAADIAAQAVQGAMPRAQAEKLIRSLPDPYSYFKEKYGSRKPAASSLPGAAPQDDPLGLLTPQRTY